MKIDWFTFFAQIINFLILLALLKRFLYGPILKAIADREAEIASRFETARQEQTAAEAARRGFETKSEELAQAKQHLLAEAADEVERWKSDRLSEARHEVDDSRSNWFAGLERERKQLREKLLAEYRRHSLRLAEGVLTCLADVDGQAFLVDSFVRQLKSNRSEIGFASAHGLSSDEEITVHSAFELNESQRTAIADVLRLAGYGSGQIHFRMDESLICGVEVRGRDHEISWNARESLDWLAREFSRDLDEVLAAPASSRDDSEVRHAS